MIFSMGCGWEDGWEGSGDVSNNVYMMVIMVIDYDVGGRMGGRSLENWEDLSLASGHSLHRLKLRPVFQNVYIVLMFANFQDLASGHSHHRLLNNLHPNVFKMFPCLQMFKVYSPFSMISFSTISSTHFFLIAPCFKIIIINTFHGGPIHPLPLDLDYSSSLSQNIPSLTQKTGLEHNI